MAPRLPAPGNRQLRPLQSRLDLHPVRERERLQQTRVGAEVEARREDPAVLFPTFQLQVPLDLPSSRRRQQPVHRQTAVVALDVQALQLQIHLPPVQLEAAPPEPVCPGVQERDPHRRARLHILAEPAPLAEQLLTAVAQGATDHPRLGDEDRLHPAQRLAFQRQCWEPLLAAFADHRLLIFSVVAATKHVGLCRWWTSASRLAFPPMDGMGSREAQLRDAYVPNRRVRLASDVAGICAALLLFGLLGTALTWWGRSAFFDLASNSHGTVKINGGFLVGPALILIALPLVLGRARQVALTRYFKTRLAIAALLWFTGLVALLVRVAGLDSSYEIEAGTYVSAALLLLGFVSTLAMWPGDLPVVQVNRKGTVREPTVAAGPRERSPTGP